MIKNWFAIRHTTFITKNMNINRLIMTNPMLKNSLPFKHWHELQNSERIWFINNFTHIYSQQYPNSNTIRSLHKDRLQYTNGNFVMVTMDAPNIFSFFYEEILKNSYLNNHCQRFNHPQFHNLLIKRRS